MAAKKILKKIFETGGEGVRNAVRETGKQAADTARQFEAQLLYGTTTLTNEQVQQGLQKDKTQSSKEIEDIQKELAAQTGTASSPQKENPKQNTPTPKEEPKVSDALWGNDGPPKPKNPVNEQLKQELHRRQVEDILEGPRSGSREDQEKQQKRQLELEEETKKKNDVKQNLDNPIEAPSGRSTGNTFKRKKNAPRMRPPKTGENKVGQGGRE